MNSRITISDLVKAKREGRALTAVSCYDYTTARLVAQAEVDVILVGDSAAQLMLGYDSTLPATMDLMVTLTAAVRRGAPNAYLIADMPFLSYHISEAEALRNAGRFLVKGGAQMVKIETTGAHLDTVRALRAAAEVSQIITERVEVPVISCGSGPGCDGQILVAPDILGLSEGKPPKFAKAYTDLGSQTLEAFRSYSEEVKSRQFPDADHSYHMKAGELQRLQDMLSRKP